MKSRFATFLALATLSVSAFAQSPIINGIAHVAYRVSDLDKEVAFLQKLGYQESFGFTNAAGKTTEVFIKINDRQFFEVYPQTDPAQKLGWMHVCYESADIDALYAALVAHGLKPTPVRKAGAGNMLTTMDDPEGRTTEFTQYMPGSRHSLDKGLHLGDQRISDQLLGFSLPVPDLDAARKFYTTGLGFDARDTKNGLRLTIPGVPTRAFKSVLPLPMPHLKRSSACPMPPKQLSNFRPRVSSQSRTAIASSSATPMEMFWRLSRPAHSNRTGAVFRLQLGNQFRAARCSMALSCTSSSASTFSGQTWCVSTPSSSCSLSTQEATVIKQSRQRVL